MRLVRMRVHSGTRSEVTGFDVPADLVLQVAVYAPEHLGGILVALQLQVEPGTRDWRQLAAVRLPVGAQMSHVDAPGIDDGRRRLLQRVKEEEAIVEADIVPGIARDDQG